MRGLVLWRGRPQHGVRLLLVDRGVGAPLVAVKEHRRPRRRARDVAANDISKRWSRSTPGHLEHDGVAARIRLTGDEPILYRSISIQGINQDECGLVAARQHDVTTITDGCRAALERALVLVPVAQLAALQGTRRREHSQGPSDRRSAASSARRSAHAAGGLATGRQGRRARPDAELACSAGPGTGVLGDVQGRVALLAPRSGGLRPSLTSPARAGGSHLRRGARHPVIGRRAAPRVGDDLLLATRRPRQAGSWRASLPLASVSRWPARAVSFDQRCALRWCSSPRVTCRCPPAPQLLVVLVAAGSGDQLRRDQHPEGRLRLATPRRAAYARAR
jgi:hypothetical protein